MKILGNLTSETFGCAEDFKSQSFKNLKTLELSE